MAKRAASRASAEKTYLGDNAHDARRLWQTDDVKEWQEMLSWYETCLKNHTTKDKDKLATLNKFHHEELPATVKSRTPPHITRDELLKLATFKFTRGKFRPLMKKLETNMDEEVKQATTQGFAALLDTSKSADARLRLALGKVTELNAVGPATGSLLLSVCDPSQAPYMSDEAVESVTRGEIKYTVPVYIEFAMAVQKKAKILGGDWTAELVGKTLWTAYHRPKGVSRVQTAPACIGSAAPAAAAVAAAAATAQPAAKADEAPAAKKTQ